MDLLAIKDLTFTYPQKNTPALRNLSLSIREGEFVVLCGSSGCGKTTLLRLLKKQIAPHGTCTGSICYDRIPLSELDERRAACEIGFVRQDPEQQIVTDKVWHELAFGLENMGVDSRTIRRRVGEMACFFGIDRWFLSSTDTLSGGQKQLLNLASVMVMQPGLLLLDEPTSQLDPIAASDFIATLQKLNRELGLTILLAEHRLEEVFPIADRVCIMEQGEILFYDTPAKAGSKLYQSNRVHPMADALPTAVRLYNELNAQQPAAEDVCPLTVREGRDYIKSHFPNTIRALPSPRTLSSDSSAPGTPVMILSDLWFRYGKKQPDVLADLSFTLCEREFFALLGGNGSGKSTLINVVTGIEKAYHGTVSFFGRPLSSYKNQELFQKNLAVLPQNPHFMFIRDQIYDDFADMCDTIGYTKDETGAEINRISDLLGISEILTSHPYDVSGGELQKAALGKILLLKPRILFLDEPTKGMDAHSKNVLAGMLLNLRQEGLTIFMVTHDVEFAARYATRCGLLFDRKIISVDEPTAFFSGNNFYTTAANRMSRGYYDNTVICEDLIKLCKLNISTFHSSNTGAAKPPNRFN